MTFEEKAVVAKAVSLLVEECYGCAVRHGWYDGADAVSINIPEKLALVHSEVSEALEDFREGRMAETAEADGKPVGFPSELADVIIRIFDLCGKLQIDLPGAILRKMEFNEKRPYRHGNKAC